MYDGDEAETNWISKEGKATVTYADGSTFAGTFDAEKLKQVRMCKAVSREATS